jgi:hypothetical protein
MTTFEKHIYNTYLAVSRSSKNKPFKLRKNFEKIDEVQFIAIKRIATFLKKFPHIKIEDYFKAPYSLYPDEPYFPLDYYASLKATKSYTLFQKKIVNMDPDSEEQLSNIKQSLVFILNFCNEAKVSPQNYINHKTNNEYSFMVHLKEHKVNIYTLLGFEVFEKNLKSRDPEIIRFIIGDDFYNNISTYRTKLYNSKKALRLVDLGLKKISSKYA